MTYREFCLRCRRAKRVCQCADIRSFEAGPVFVILIHPIERRMKTGTGRLAHLCITNSVYIEGTDFNDNERVNALINDPKYYPVVLYPGINSVELPQLEVPREKQLLIFVIDGTWHLAKSMLNRSPNLIALPQIRFTPNKLSNFHFRRQPHPICLSSLEAIHYLLESFEPGRPEHAFLLDAFDKMVARQMSFARRY